MLHTMPSELYSIQHLKMCYFSNKVSIVAKQSGNMLGEYETDSGYSLEFLYYGKLSAKVKGKYLVRVNGKIK